MAHDNTRFIEQAKDYMGTPYRIARCHDRYGEQHVIIENRLDNGDAFWLDWIGAEYAPEPDEYDVVPFSALKWKKL